MQVLNNYNCLEGLQSELIMQEEVDAVLKKQKYYKIDKYYPYTRTEIPFQTLREFQVPEIGRISDHVIYFNKKKIVNIECKLIDVTAVIRQAEDHLRWADYSIICLPADQMMYGPEYITKCIRLGIGIFFWFRGIGLFEFVYPKYNRNKNPKIRESVLKRLSPIVDQQKLFED